MKLALIAVAAALTMAFCTKEKPAKSQAIGKAWPWNYYTYIGDPGDYVHQFDESYYVLDENGFPDCLNTMGYIRCSVKCMGDPWEEGRPDFSTIQSVWYRPL
jgi:hypothetical protein